MDPIEPFSDKVEHLNAQWRELHSRLRQQEQVLSQEIERYVRGQGPRPEDLMKEVEAMRAECADRFRALMEALRKQGAAGKPQQQQQPQQQAQSGGSGRARAQEERRGKRRAGPPSTRPSAA